MGCGSEIRENPILGPGSLVQGSKRHRIPGSDPQQCITFLISFLKTEHC